MTDTSKISRVLLDTNAFLYFINNDAVLSETARKLRESDVEVFLSSVSLWEIAIKFSIGKLSLPGTFADFIPTQIEQNDIGLLPITLPYLERVSILPFHHKDPFDRLIIAQSLVDDFASGNLGYDI